MRIAVGSDHAGFVLRRSVADHLKKTGHQVEECGPSDSFTKVDYPEYAKIVAEAVRDGRADMGVLVCNSGQGVCMAAGAVRGIMAARCLSVKDAKQSREHNRANVVCLSQEQTDTALALQIVDTFLSTAFTPGDDGRHERRVNEVLQMKKGN